MKRKELEGANEPNKRLRSSSTKDEILRMLASLDQLDDLVAVLDQAKAQCDVLSSKLVSSVPDELWRVIFFCAPLTTLIALGSVSKQFHTISEIAIQTKFSHLCGTRAIGFQRFSDLKEFEIHSGIAYRPLSELSYLTSLEKLKMSKPRPVVSTLTNLTKLNITSGSLGDIPYLPNLRHLKTCAFDTGEYVLTRFMMLNSLSVSTMEIEPFVNLTNLRSLTLFYTQFYQAQNSEDYLSRLTYLSKLKVLSILDRPQALTVLTNLKSLGLPNQDYLPDEYFSLFPNLDSISYTHVSSEILRLTHLRSLMICGNHDRQHINLQALSSLKKLEFFGPAHKLSLPDSLEWLNLGTPGCTNFAKHQHLTNLTSLSVFSRLPFACHHLTKFTKLESLSIETPEALRNTFSLTKLTNLTILKLSRSLVHVDIPSKLPKLKFLSYNALVRKTEYDWPLTVKEDFSSFSDSGEEWLISASNDSDEDDESGDENEHSGYSESGDESDSDDESGGGSDDSDSY